MDTEALEQVCRQGQGGEPNGRRPLAGPGIRVHVRARLGNVVEREGIEVGPLRQYLPQLHMVLLARPLLARLHRIAVEHPGAARSARAGLDLREVQELRAAISQHHREDVFENAFAIGLHRVEGGLHVGLVLVLEQDEKLEEQADEVEREDALRVAAEAFHAVHLDGEQLEVVGQGEPVGVGPAGKVHLGLAVRPLLARGVLDLLGQLDVG